MDLCVCVSLIFYFYPPHTFSFFKKKNLNGPKRKGVRGGEGEGWFKVMVMMKGLLHASLFTANGWQIRLALRWSWRGTQGREGMGNVLTNMYVCTYSVIYIGDY